MKKIKWEQEHIEIEPVKNPKKITGTRLASILGANRWNSPFKTWCEITRTYQEPFEDNKYTLAGKVIEPVLLNLLNTRYFMDVKTPVDVYGADYFKRTFGDFYHNNKTFGGMWDGITEDRIIEIKTSSRPEDWLDSTPEYYLLQTALYAWLSNKPNFTIVCAFLDESDYEKPESFTPVVGENVLIREYVLDELYPRFYEDYIEPAMDFWTKHVATGISPAFTKADEEIIKALRRETVDVNEDINSVIERINELKAKVEELSVELTPLEKELKAKEELLKDYLKEQFTEGVDKLDVSTGVYNYTLSKTTSSKADTAKMKKDGIYDNYVVTSVTYRLTNKKI